MSAIFPGNNLFTILLILLIVDTYAATQLRENLKFFIDLDAYGRTIEIMQLKFRNMPDQLQ